MQMKVTTIWIGEGDVVVGRYGNTKSEDDEDRRDVGDGICETVGDQSTLRL